MDGVHDLGGMHGFGPVDTADDGPFHDDWEVHFHALTRVLGVHGLYTADENRYVRERTHPAAFLRADYYEQRLLPLERLLVERGVLDDGEVDARMAAGTDRLPVRSDPELAARVREAIATDSSFEREPKPPRFDPGDDVVVRNVHHDGHTRCPRYVRRAHGVVEAFHGTQRFPDAVTDGVDVGEPLYSVRFAASELWGDGHPDGDEVVLQLWEPYLRDP